MPEQDAKDSADARNAARGDLRGPAAGLTARVPGLVEATTCAGPEALHSTLARIGETAAQLTGARRAAVAVDDVSGEGPPDLVTYGLPQEDARATGRSGGVTGLAGATTHEPGRAPRADPAAGPRRDGLLPDHPETRTFLEVPIRVQREVFGHLRVAEKRGGGTFGDDDLNVLRVLATEAGIAVGHARLYEAARQRERWIDGSVAVTTALLSGGDADESLTVVAEQARRLAEAATGIVLLPAGSGGLEIVAAAGETPSVSLGLIIPPESPTAAALLAGEAVFVDEAATDTRVITRLAGRYGPHMLLPLRSGGRVLGALAMARARGDRPFTGTERTLATQFAAQAALALKMAESQRDRERLAVFEDRDRIARDLHDLVIQRLFATGMMLERAQRLAVAPEVRSGVGRAVDELDVTIQEIRTAVFALQPEQTEAPPGLRTRVLREINLAAVPLGFRPTHRFVGPVESLVGELAGKNLIAALREALSNTFRHAAASRVEVTVDATAILPDGREAVRLSVADDGVGIPDSGRRSGLRNLARRAEALGGSSWFGPGAGEDGGGTTLVWQVPL
ncbi:sensor histidine kinase [Streptomyces griseus]|uniref:sensor histidine kinase n=1 Tax=Streptomyces griseus TaxID=1911 RepID=UPI00083FF303|nr:GAF domain-containing protein [Streptomyces griseus]